MTAGTCALTAASRRRRLNGESATAPRNTNVEDGDVGAELTVGMRALFAQGAKAGKGPYATEAEQPQNQAPA